jgi:hypothetical protein
VSINSCKRCQAQNKQAALAAKKKAKKNDNKDEVVEETSSNEPLSYKQLLQQEQNKFKSVAKNRAAETADKAKAPAAKAA